MPEVKKPKAQPRSNHRPVIVEKRHGIYTALGYRSARTATAEGRSYTSHPSSEHELRDRGNLIAQSRDFMRNNAIYKGMINSAVSYIIANGFELQVTTGSKNINKKIEKLWKDWLKRPEITNKLSGQKSAQMVCREVMVAGDVTALKTDKGVIQLFEAEQVAGKRRGSSGIKTDNFGRPITFKLNPWKATGVDLTNPTPAKAKDILYVANLERPSQLRGVPAAQAAFAMLHRINDVCDSEAIAWQILSRLAVSIERENAAEVSYTESREDEGKSDTDGDLAERVTDIDYALMFHANPGEKISGIDRNIPGKDFGASLRMFLRMLGLPLGIPLEITLLDWTQSNYSQSRAVLQQAYQRFLNWQELVDSFFYSPLFEWKLPQWQEAGLIGKRNKIAYEFIKPAYPWLDQLKEAKAWATQVERGFVTHSQVCKSLNTDRQDVIDRRQLEVEDAIDRAEKIMKKHPGVNVPWEIFAGLKPGGDKGELAADAETPDANENKEG